MVRVLLMLLLPLPRGSIAYTSTELDTMPCGGATCVRGDPFACFGNGECSSGRCVCDAGWTGANCTVLDLGPAPHNGAIRRPGWSTWGGSPIRGEDGRIHLFASQMANHCPLGLWQNNSLVVHAIAGNVTGPYTLQKELVLPPFHHNPSIQRAPDGSYLIYCIGAKAGSCLGGPDSNCSGATLKHCTPPSSAAAPEPRSQQHHAAVAERVRHASLDGVVHLAHSRSLFGPWTLQPADKPILAGRSGRWDAASTNPAPHILKNGTALLVYRGLNGLATDRVGAARASHWAGPYERVVDEPLFGRCGNWTSSRASAGVPADTGCEPVHNWSAALHRNDPGFGAVCDDCIGWAEDPFLYSTRRGYHILTHNLHGIGGRTVDPIAWWVGYAFSPNFIDWRYSHEPVATNTFTSLENGETVTLRGRERPQLLLSDDGVPEALFSGAVPSAGAPPQLAGTFTFVQPVRNVPRGPR